MNRRLTVYELGSLVGLNETQVRHLATVVGVDQEPDWLVRRLPHAVAFLGASLVGLGVILWLAANWPDLDRATKFALLQALIACAGTAGFFWAPVRSVALLLAFFAQGGVFAYFGQTYQTGADTWELFAWWAACGLPLALAARHDTVWLAWGVVATAAISLWTEALAGYGWRFRAEVSHIYYLAWMIEAVLIALLGPFPRLRSAIGSGPWSFRYAVIVVVAHVCMTALSALFDSSIQAHFAVGLGITLVACALFGRGRFFDVVALSSAVLAVDVLLIGGAAHFLFDEVHGDTGILLLLGLFSAGVVAASAATARSLISRHTAMEQEVSQ